MAVYEYRTTGTCSKKIFVELEGRTIKSVRFTSGCNGNLKGISLLVAGRDVDEVISMFKDVRCTFMPSSCPAQLALALREACAAQEAEQHAGPVIEQADKEKT